MSAGAPGPEPDVRPVRGLRWWLWQLSGDARYERHLARCRAEGVAPLDRAAYERARSDHRDRHPEGRCC